MTLNEQGLFAMAKRIDALDDALRERDRQLLLALFALREAKALLAYRDGQPGVWEHEHHEILELAENAKPNMEWAKVERRKTQAWCKEHKCSMHYCSHDRRKGMVDL